MAGSTHRAASCLLHALPSLPRSANPSSHRPQIAASMQLLAACSTRSAQLLGSFGGSSQQVQSFGSRRAIAAPPQRAHGCSTRKSSTAASPSTHAFGTRTSNERWATVTGAAGDLGSAISIALARDGWSLHLCDHPSQAERLKASLSAVAAVTQEGASAYSDTFDVTDEADVERAMQAHVELHGGPAAVVANAGIQGHFAPVQAYPIADLRRVLEVNVVGVFTVVAAAGRAMIAARSEHPKNGGWGSIVLTASMAGVSGAANMPAYSASKAAVLGLAKSAAKDLAPHGIRVNSVSPGFIGPGAMWDNQVAKQAAAGTQYYSSDPAAVAQQMIGSIPLRRFGSPAEVADVVAYLASDRSSYLTGTNTEISGGAA